MDNQKIDQETIKARLVEAFSVLDGNILRYTNPSGLTHHYYEEAFLMTKRILLKHNYPFMICELQEVASDLPEVSIGLQEFLPKISSYLQCLVFVIPDQKKWSELRPAIELVGGYFDCKMVAVRSEEEALEIFHEMDGDNCPKR